MPQTRSVGAYRFTHVRTQVLCTRLLIYQ